MSGKVVDEKGGELPGVTVVATHVPTGTKRGTATEADGRFTIPTLTSGGPYTVEVSYVGYKTQRADHLFLTLGNTLRLTLALAPETTQLNEVSNFDLRHRIVSTIGYHKSYAQRFTLSVSLVYQSGSPYTYVYNKFFNNGQQNVQLAYIPSGPSDILLLNPATGKLDQTGTQYAALNSYIEGDNYLSTRRGEYTERNAAPPGTTRRTFAYSRKSAWAT